mgnify:CR=1 FL=1
MNDEFILKYSKLIYSLTHYFEGYPQKEDLYQAGCVGLLLAYQNFDESYGVKFSTYAYSFILGEMKKLVREDKGIKISRKLIKLNTEIELARERLMQKLMREPTLEEISYVLGIDQKELEAASIAIKSLISLDNPIHMEENDVFLSDVIPSNMMDFNTLIALKEELSDLNPMERKLVIERFISSKSQSEVAEILGINQVQVSRFEKKIKEKIKTRLVA